MDCDLFSRRTRSGRKATQLVLLPDAGVSDPDNESDSDYGGQHEEDSSDEGLSSQGSDSDTPLSSNVINRKSPTGARRQATPTASAQKPSKSTHAFTWQKRKFTNHQNIEWKGTISDPPEEKTPIEYFNMFFSSEMVSHVVEQTNIYSVQLGSTFRTDQNEIEKYIGVLMKMGLVHMPRYAMYWSSETRYPPVADVISRNRFTDLNKHIHFNDNSKLITNRDDAAYDRYYKIRPVLVMLRESCLRIEPEDRMSIDEQMIPYKGKNSLRQYLPKKPKNGVLKS